MIQKSTSIYLKRVAFFAYHGVSPQERKVGNTFIIDLRIKVDLQKAARTDKLEDTISYADVYNVLSEEMAIPSNLLENVCLRIIERLAASFASIEEIEIRLAKKNPPIGADLDSAGVEMHYVI